MRSTDETDGWRRFELLAIRVLTIRGFRVGIHSPRGDLGFDLDGERDAENWAIEVKYYRTERAQPSLIASAASRLVRNGVKANRKKGMLIVSCVLSDELRASLEEKFGVALVDRTDLRAWAGAEPVLVAELDAIVEAGVGAPQEARKDRNDNRLISRSLSSANVGPPETTGRDLCNELKTVKRGKQDWARYEELCARVLRYLFSNDLHGWHKQRRTDDGLNRFDFVCRVKPGTEFWSFLIDHLNSRYVLFEFKNYRAPIKQMQMLTTEKYLLDRGLRRAAIIFTRLGGDSDALKMAQGAMREHGKLMLVLDDKFVCEMLHKKDRGEDPTDLLFELADDFLLRLPR